MVRKFSSGANQVAGDFSFIPGAGCLVPRGDAPLDPAENADRRDPHRHEDEGGHEGAGGVVVFGALEPLGFRELKREDRLPPTLGFLGIVFWIRRYSSSAPDPWA